MLDDALNVLLSDHLSHVVELALHKQGDAVRAVTRKGAAVFNKDGLLSFEGLNPLERQDLASFTPLSAEQASARPARDANVYPFAYSNAAQLFANEHAPDIAVVHTAAHNWESRGGHRGEHGSLDLVQSRAPLIVAGEGVRAEGMVARGARMLDINPMIRGFLDDGARAVVTFLWDGTNANVLYEMAAAGELPHVARLMAAGTTYAHGCIASFPSVTLANHTTAVTGVHPGEHGVLNNFYFDRGTRRQVVANSPETWHLAREKVAPSVRTIFEQIEGPTAAVNEPVDRGATYATFDVVRAAGGWGAMAAAVPAPSEVPGGTRAFMEVREYAFSAAADHLAVQQAAEVWRATRPRLMWVNLILPDAANHAGGPYSEIGYAGLRETDARMGRIIEAVGEDGVTFVLFADHGMEESDPACTGDWDEALERAGIPFRDEGYGFIYLGA